MSPRDPLFDQADALMSKRKRKSVHTTKTRREPRIEPALVSTAPEPVPAAEIRAEIRTELPEAEATQEPVHKSENQHDGIPDDVPPDDVPLLTDIITNPSTATTPTEAANALFEHWLAEHLPHLVATALADSSAQLSTRITDQLRTGWQQFLAQPGKTPVDK